MEHTGHMQSLDGVEVLPQLQPSTESALSHYSMAREQLQKLKQDAQRWLGALERPVHPCTLGAYRIVHGLALLAHVIHMGEAQQALQETYFMLPTWHMLPPLPPATSTLLVAAAFLSGLALLLGLFTWASSVVALVITAYLRTMLQQHDSRAASLLQQLGVLNCCLQLNRWGAVDCLLPWRKARKGAARVPFWNLVLLRALLLKPHLQDALAKANGDWLFSAQPLWLWLHARHGLLGMGFLPWLVSTTTLVMDLAVPYLLLHPKMRYTLGFAAVLVTQAMNHQAFGLDGCTFLAASTLLAFLPPEAMARGLRGRKGDVEAPAAAATAAAADAAGGLVGSFHLGWSNCRIGVVTGPQPPPPTPSPAPASPGAYDADDEASGKGRHGSVHRRRLLYVFVCAFVVVNVLLPMHHWLLYPSKPSWTEEGHPAAWHARLRSKQGWLYLVAQEVASQQVLDLVPDTDTMLLAQQVRSLDSPAALLQYCWRLQQLFDAAGRPLESMRAMSCYSLNGHSHKALHDATVNLLQYSPSTYRWPGQTAVSKWVHDWDTAPSCDPHAPPQWRYGMIRRSRDAYDALQHAAGLRRHVSHDGGDSPRQLVCRAGKDGSCEQLAYLWNATWMP